MALAVPLYQSEPMLSAGWEYMDTSAQAAQIPGCLPTLIQTSGRY